MNLKEIKHNQLRYLTTAENMKEWGIVATTVGYQHISPQGAYPPSNHPNNYRFKPQIGRILNEYQLVYITNGNGYFFNSESKIEIKAGTILFLLPGKWHSYYPDPDTGWDEYWVGFKGSIIDGEIKKAFKLENQAYNVGINVCIQSLYEDMLYIASQEKPGYQQLISSIIIHLLGEVYFKHRNNSFTNSNVIDKINEARKMIKDNIENPTSIQEIAARLNVGYTWFRRMFKEYTGNSPAQYQMQQKIIRSKELLLINDLNIKEIAYKLGFENGGQFSTFFKKREGITPTQFRQRMSK